MDFAKLLEKAQQLTSHTETQNYFLQRNVEQMDKAARELAQKTTRQVDVESTHRAFASPCPLPSSTFSWAMLTSSPGTFSLRRRTLTRNALSASWPRWT